MNPSPQPEIAVVIPTYRRESRLAFALDALAAQTLAPGRFEVIVVRDSDAPPITTAPPGLAVRFETLSGPGPSMRRNHGWRIARAPLIAFTDDDCRPAEDWLERMLDAWQGGDVILQGRTEPDPDERVLLTGLARSIHIIGPDRWFATCNIAYPRALLERLDGFDESLVFLCEDTELGLRAEMRGARQIFVGEAVVWHAIHVRSVRAALSDATKRHSEARVLARYPSLRRELYLGAFVSESHFRWTVGALGAALGLALGGRRGRRIAALATYPYVILVVGKRPAQPGFFSPRGLARFLVDLGIGGLVDGVEVTMRARSSAKARSVAL